MERFTGMYSSLNLGIYYVPHVKPGAREGNVVAGLGLLLPIIWRKKKESGAKCPAPSAETAALNDTQLFPHLGELIQGEV
jgi:hypothetical protein